MVCFRLRALLKISTLTLSLHETWLQATFSIRQKWLSAIMWQIDFQSNPNLFSAGSSVQTLIPGIIHCYEIRMTDSNHLLFDYYLQLVHAKRILASIILIFTWYWICPGRMLGYTIKTVSLLLCTRGSSPIYAVYADVPLDRYGLAKNCLT